jgi:hypothetical protein
METLGKIKELVEQLSVDTVKFFEKENKSAGIRARKEAQQLKGLCQDLRKEILDSNKE